MWRWVNVFKIQPKLENELILACYSASIVWLKRRYRRNDPLASKQRADVCEQIGCGHCSLQANEGKDSVLLVVLRKLDRIIQHLN